MLMNFDAVCVTSSSRLDFGGDPVHVMVRVRVGVTDAVAEVCPV